MPVMLVGLGPFKLAAVAAQNPILHGKAPARRKGVRALTFLMSPLDRIVSGELSVRRSKLPKTRIWHVRYRRSSVTLVPIGSYRTGVDIEVNDVFSNVTIAS